jgi:uncharacterized damage-inducible protein DinB
MHDKERFLQTFEFEHGNTVKAMKAFPADKLAWRAHERSMSVRELMFRFIGEQMIWSVLPTTGFPAPTKEPPMPELSLDQLIDTFEKGYQDVRTVLHAIPEADFNSKSTIFFGRPMKLSDACWLLLKDQIHHRGQLSVYIRLAGGKVPSIYGPSADDPGM